MADVGMCQAGNIRGAATKWFLMQKFASSRQLGWTWGRGDVRGINKERDTAEMTDL